MYMLHPVNHGHIHGATWAAKIQRLGGKMRLSGRMEVHEITGQSYVAQAIAMRRERRSKVTTHASRGYPEAINEAPRVSTWGIKRWIHLDALLSEAP